jgi:hypothetical protein
MFICCILVLLLLLLLLQFTCTKCSYLSLSSLLLFSKFYFHIDESFPAALAVTGLFDFIQHLISLLACCSPGLLVKLLCS